MTQIDCTKALVVLYQFLDGELTTSRRDLIMGHLDGCSHCLSAFDFEAELRIVVRSRLQKQVPDNVRLRVMSALMAEGCPPPPNLPTPNPSIPNPSTPSLGVPDLGTGSLNVGNAAPGPLGGHVFPDLGAIGNERKPPGGGPLAL